MPLIVTAWKRAIRGGNAARARALLPWVKLLTPRPRGEKVERSLDLATDAAVAIRAMKDQHWAAARACLEELIGKHGPEPDLISSLAWTHVEAGQPTEAHWLAEEVLKTKLSLPQQRAIEHTLAVARLQMGQITDAHALLEEEARRPSLGDELDAVRWFWLGEARRLANRSDAREAYQRCIETDPDGEYRKRAELRLAEAAPYR